MACMVKKSRESFWSLRRLGVSLNFQYQQALVINSVFSQVQQSSTKQGEDDILL